MKRILKIALLFVFVLGGSAAWIFLTSATGFNSAREYLYIRTNGATKQTILDSIKKNKIVTNISAFNFLASRFGYWEGIKPGKYEIKKGTSLLSIIRMLRNGNQVPVNLVITKLRTKEDFARFTGVRFEFDSSQMITFLNESDSLKKYDADTTTAIWNVLPDTYKFIWNTSPSVVYRKLYDESKKFWNEERKTKAFNLGLSPLEVYILASIIEEETTNNSEKDTIASVYLNRLKRGMPLGADPTLKYAVRNFALKRIAGDIMHVVSPYNTYKNKGLPPGPICTPSKLTIDKVLNAAQTSYLYFVANRKLNGHLFSESFEEHIRKANLYREEDKKRREKDSLQNQVK
ncbi:MAG: endolytic transglycosylase MltG [Bacteroidota bacterium]|nr:endolytic transglycosylase MltG [Bacteroidota bacterium]